MSDQLVRAISKDGFVKAAAVSTRALTERARQIHQTSPVATAALGRLLAAGSMMGNELKGDGSSVTLRIKGDGPLGTLLVVADNEGNVRGSVQNPQIDLPIREDGKLDVGGAVGHGGTLTVIKDLNLKEPYVGSVELLGGEIAEDLAAFGITNTVRYKAAPDTAFCREMRAVADVEARAGMAERDGIRASNESRGPGLTEVSPYGEDAAARREARKRRRSGNATREMR